jgi:hypothetical protein
VEANVSSQHPSFTVHVPAPEYALKDSGFFFVSLAGSIVWYGESSTAGRSFLRSRVWHCLKARVHQNDGSGSASFGSSVKLSLPKEHRVMPGIDSMLSKWIVNRVHTPLRAYEQSYACGYCASACEKALPVKEQQDGLAHGWMVL